MIFRATTVSELSSRGRVHALTVYASIPLEQVEAHATTNGVVAHLEAKAAEANGSAEEEEDDIFPISMLQEAAPKEEEEEEEEEAEPEEEEEESDDVGSVLSCIEISLTLCRMLKLLWSLRHDRWTSGKRI